MMRTWRFSGKSPRKGTTMAGPKVNPLQHRSVLKHHSALMPVLHPVCAAAATSMSTRRSGISSTATNSFASLNERLEKLESSNSAFDDHLRGMQAELDKTSEFIFFHSLYS